MSKQSKKTVRMHPRRAAQAYKIAAIGAAATAMMAVSHSYAADIQWNVADGLWADASNWNGGVLPGTTDRALLDFATPGATSHVGTTVGDVQTVTIKNGDLLSIEANGSLKTLVGSTGVLDGLTYTGVINDAAQAFRVGDGSLGLLSVSDDGKLIHSYNTPTANSSADLYIGVGTGGLGSFTQTGATSQVSARDLRIGSDTASGNVTLSGGTTTTNFTIVGRTGGSGSLTVNGGTLTQSGQFNVADSNSSSGIVNLISGKITGAGPSSIGIGGGGTNTTATMTQTGGTFTAATSISIGKNGTSSGTARGFGTYILGADSSSTASIVVTSAAPSSFSGFIGVGYNGGVGNMTINGGTITTASGFYVGINDGGAVNNRADGTVAMHGGTINVGTLFAVGNAAGTGNMTMDGGIINATGVGSVGWDGERTNNGRTTLTIGTLTQTGGTINAAGGFTIGTGSGTGIYTLDGGAVLNAGTGVTGDLLLGGPDAVTAVSARQGTVNIGGSAAVTVAARLRMGESNGKGTLTMTGGTLTVNGTATSLLGQSGSAAKPGTGIFTLNGATALATFAGAINVADGNNTTGTVTVTAGTLKVGGNSVFGSGGTGIGTLNVNGGNATFTGNLTIGDSANSTGTANISSGSLTVGGTLVAGRQTSVSGVITISGTGLVNAGNVSVRTGTGTVAATDFNVTGGTLNTGNVTNNSTFDYTGGTVNLTGAILGTGTTTVAGGLNLAATSVTQTAINVTGVLQAKPGAGISKVTNFTFGSGGKFDLTNTKLIVPGLSGVTQYTAVNTLVNNGRNGGQWDGTGIVTSLTNAKSPSILTNLAVVQASDLMGISGTQTSTYQGQTVTASDTLVVYTYGGDADINGKIDADDYFLLDSNYNKSGVVNGWYFGDFNNSGTIDGDDYFIIDSNYGAQTTAFGGAAGVGELSGVSAVPEPGSLSLLALAGLALRRRRRS